MAIVPQDPASRKTWQERLFAPLTAPLIAALRREGLDLLTPAGQAAPLNSPSATLIAEQFREMASGFRELTVTRRVALTRAGRAVLIYAGCLREEVR